MPSGPARGRQVRVHEEVAEPGVRQVLLDPAPDPGSRRRRHRLPRATRTVGALGKPARRAGIRPNSRWCSARPTASWSRMLSSRASSGRKPWVAAEPMISSRPSRSSARKPAMMSPPSSRKRRRRRLQPVAPELDQRQQMRPRRVAASDAGASSQAASRWAKNASISADEGRARELVGEHRRDAEW